MKIKLALTFNGDDDNNNLGKTEEKDEKNSWGPGDFVLRKEEKIWGVRGDDLWFFAKKSREEFGGVI